MTEHIPECLNDDDTYGWRRWCICDELRACENRVNSSNLTMWNHTQQQAQHMIDSGLGIAWKDGFNEGLNAAREALDALPTEQTVKEGVSEFWVEINHAIAAIDALRGDSND